MVNDDQSTTIAPSVTEEHPPNDNADGEEEPFIAEHRVADTLTGYRPRKKRIPGQPIPLTQRDWFMYHAQYRRKVTDHHAFNSFDKLTQRYYIDKSWEVWINEERYQRKLQSNEE